MRYPIPKEVTEALEWLDQCAKFDKETWKWTFEMKDSFTDEEKKKFEECMKILEKDANRKSSLWDF